MSKKTSHQYDWNDLHSLEDFEEMVAYLIFFEKILSTQNIRYCHRSEFFHSVFDPPDGNGLAFRVVFADPSLSDKERASAIEERFQSFVKELWSDPEAKTRLVLYINTDNPPAHWTADHEHLAVMTRSQIAEIIAEHNWWPVFHKYLDDVMHIEDADECEFLRPLGEELNREATGLSVSQTKNILSWIEGVSFYRPKEVLEYCQTLHAMKKESETVTDSPDGPVTLTQSDYSGEMIDVLMHVGAHEEYADAAHELIDQLQADVV